MTREQAHAYGMDNGDLEAEYHDIINEIFEYVESLEQRIAELESPKTCYGCIFTTDGRYNCTHWSSNEEDCCSRYTDLIDYYQPKQ